jgi:hypothetical protein
MNILQAMDDPAVFDPWFKGRDSWVAWRAFLAALFGIEMGPELHQLYQAATGRTQAPNEPAREGWLVVGRRGGKSFILALIAVYLATFRDWRAYLAPGERATAMVIAADRRQARVIMRYIRGLLYEIPMLAALVKRDSPTTGEFELSNRVTLEIHTASFRAVRGYTICAALLDEIAFWTPEGSADPDTEIVAAIRPAMATLPGAMLLAPSSPYARRGVLWDAYRNHWGQDGPILCWHAPTRVMNPGVPERVVQDAYEADPASAAAEYGAEFRTDIERLVPLEVVQACVEPECFELPPWPSRHYVGFVDPSGGSADSMTLAIAHKEGDLVVLDAIRERRPPFNPEAVVADYALTLGAYRVRRVHGDRYAGEWPRQVFRRHGVEYVPSERAKSDLYREALPLLNARVARLLDDVQLVRQIVGLERRVSRGGRDLIDHAPNAHDDLANAALGALVLAAGKVGSALTQRRLLGV